MPAPSASRQNGQSNSIRTRTLLPRRADYIIIYSGPGCTPHLLATPLPPKVKATSLSRPVVQEAQGGRGNSLLRKISPEKTSLKEEGEISLS